jgi:S1-C subfamily serine protease
MPTTLETLSNQLSDAVDRVAPSVVAIHARRRIPSSGIVWRAGVVVAAHHTVQRDEDITVTLADGAEAQATVAGRDPGTDLVVLRLAGDPGTPAERVPDAPRVGQLVLAVGRPGDTVTASMGVVSAVGPEWRTWQGGRIDRFVRLDLAIYDGFSGGPLVDALGRVLGLNTSGLSRSAGVAIPVSTVDRVAEQLLAGGRVKRGFLGVGTQPVRLPEALQARARSLIAGAGDVALMIVSLAPAGPAEHAGLLLGDVLVGLDDHATADPADVIALLGGDVAGTTVQARVLRAGEPVTVPVVVGEQPSAGGGRK